MKNLHWASSCEVIEIVSSADAVETGDKTASNEATRLADKATTARSADKAVAAEVIKALSLADKAVVAAAAEPIKYAATNDTKETTSIAQTELTSASL